MSRPKSHFLNLEQNLEGSETECVDKQRKFLSFRRPHFRMQIWRVGLSCGSSNLRNSEIGHGASETTRYHSASLSLGRRFVATDKTVVKRGTVVETSTIMKIL